MRWVVLILSAAIAAWPADGRADPDSEPSPKTPPTSSQPAPDPTRQDAPFGDTTAPDESAPDQPSAPAQSAQSPAETAESLSARAVQNAPPPHRARNLVAPEPSPARHLLWVPRVALFIPKWTLWLVAQPLRQGMYAFDRYGIAARLRRLLSGSGTVTLFPSAKLESGLGVTYGIGLRVSRYVKGTFLFGGEVREIYSGTLRSADLFGDDLELELEVQLQRLKNSRFFGIGNRSIDDSAQLPSDLDALARDQAVETRFDQEVVHVELGAEWRAHEHVAGRVSSAFVDRDYQPPRDDEFVDIADTFATPSLIGFDDGARSIYSELRLIYDDRIQTNPYVSIAQPSTGWRLEGFAGYARGLADDPSSYLRWGVDLQRYIDIYRGNRILLLRTRVEGVSADIDKIPFSDLPQLGGSRIMRGYDRGRFRDRVVTAASIEYKYPVSRFLGAFLFLDIGGAWSGLDEVDATELHYGYGGGVQLHTANLFLTRLVISGGEDGVVLYLSFSPSSEVKRPTERF